MELNYISDVRSDWFKYTHKAITRIARSLLQEYPEMPLAMRANCHIICASSGRCYNENHKDATEALFMYQQLFDLNPSAETKKGLDSAQILLKFLEGENLMETATKAGDLRLWGRHSD